MINNVRIFFLFSDIDECQSGNGGCQEVCRNIIGSYTCECSTPGSELLLDGHTCGSKSTDFFDFILFIFIYSFFYIFLWVVRPSSSLIQ